MSFSLPDYEPIFPIRAAAKLLNISVHTLRMYEKEGLIIPYKKSTSHRLYSKSDIERLECIRKTINTDKISIAGIKALLSMIPCWNIKNCSETKETCGAFDNHSMPCWKMKHENNYCEATACRECEVYISFASCSLIKSKLVEISHSQNLKASNE